MLKMSGVDGHNNLPEGSQKDSCLSCARLKTMQVEADQKVGKTQLLLDELKTAFAKGKEEK